MKIIEKKIEELVPYEKNPRLNDDAVPYVANSIKDFGFNEIELLMAEDIEPDKYDNKELKEYKERANDMILKAGRLIITYDVPEEKAFLEELVKEKKDCLKVVYKAKEIIKRFE